MADRGYGEESCWRGLRCADMQGFTLLELLLVLAILAGLAFIAVGSFRGVSEESSRQLSRVGMQELARALRQFRQDTGYWPGQGPFALKTAKGPGAVEDSALARLSYSGGSVEARERWFKSPANFYQLLGGSLLPADHPLATWNAESGRGWRGPYLQGYRAYVDIGSKINDGYQNSPTDGTAVPAVPGVADAFAHRPVAGGGAAVGDTPLDWSDEHCDQTTDACRKRRRELTSLGRPFLFMEYPGPDGAETSPGVLKTFPSLVSFGPDGLYGDGKPGGADDPDNDNIVLRLE